MKVLLTGGTGFIGKHLTAELISRGHEVVIVTRRAPPAPKDKISYLSWDLAASETLPDNTPAVDAVINLAGESIGNNKWGPDEKAKILTSRVAATRSIVHAIEKNIIKPKTLINASAIGFYGTDEKKLFSEDDSAGNDFLADVCKAWEAEAIKARNSGVRVALVRTGVVLGEQGALQKMITSFKFFIGGSLGSGRQWLSWIHIRDVVNIYLYILEHNDISGPVNTVSPLPVTMKEFTDTLGKVMERPAFMNVPAFVLRVVLGEMSDLILKGQRVSAGKLLNHGFRFEYTRLSDALKDILR